MSRSNIQIALDMLPHMAAAAKDRRKITYQELGVLVHHDPRFQGAPLDFIRDQLLVPSRLPRLDAVVVNKETQEVGDSFFAGGRGNLSDEQIKDLLEGYREEVYAFGRWDEVVATIRRNCSHL